MKYGSALHPSRAGLALALLLSACATPIDFAYEGREDLSPYRTWSWAREEGQRVHAPHGDPAALEAKMNRYVEEQLQAKGFRRTRRGADFVVSYRLAVERRSRIEQEARAGYTLSSHSSAPSFRIEGTEPVVRTYQAIHVAIGASEPAGETLWRAELRQEAEDSFSLSLREAVARLLAEVPERAPHECGASEPAENGEGDRHGAEEADCAEPSPAPPPRYDFPPGEIG